MTDIARSIRTARIRRPRRLLRQRRALQVRHACGRPAASSASDTLALAPDTRRRLGALVQPFDDAAGGLLTCSPVVKRGGQLCDPPGESTGAISSLIRFEKSSVESGRFSTWSRLGEGVLKEALEPSAKV